MQLTVDQERKPSVEKAALLLALTQTREEEEKLKVSFSEVFDIRCGVTELGGKVANLQHTGKLTNSVISTALNIGIIPEEARKIHALIHATLEASNSVFTHTNSNADMALKIGLTTNVEWLAVAIYGRSSLHPLLEHARVGLGVMHL
ncbi:HutP family protein [Desulfosporosinus sp. FKB]|uniref:HutP family protein n=1 Tax=Desulfosporosinus sp. FKB TaxID=1969835 RepID=UPI000B4A2320|nr:HutP family protein [Desulfosporosinus sp. FKB]